MKEYIVTKDILNIRSSATAENDDNFIGQLTAGETLYLTDDEIIGVQPNGGATNIWKMDNLNRVVSLDGVRLKNYADKKAEFIADPFNVPYLGSGDHTVESNWKVNWGIVDLEVWKIWKNYGTQGEGVTVAVIDTGVVYNNNDLNGQIDLKRSMDYFLTTIEDTDSPTYHGTLSAGIIAANGKTASTVVGVAPGSNLIVYRLFTNDGLNGFDELNFRDVLQRARKANVDIISMSFVMPTDPKPETYTEIKACLDQGILLVAAVGDDNQTIGDVNHFPASFPNCISVGAYRKIDDQSVVYTEHSAKSKSLFCLAPGDQILTTGGLNSTAFHNYTSAATPFVAGVLALIVSHRKSKKLPISAIDIIEKLKKACDKIDNPTINDDSEGYGIINPFILYYLLIN